MKRNRILETVLLVLGCLLGGCGCLMTLGRWHNPFHDGREMFTAHPDVKHESRVADGGAASSPESLDQALDGELSLPPALSPAKSPPAVLVSEVSGISEDVDALEVFVLKANEAIEILEGPLP